MKNNKKNWFFYLILGGFLIEIARFFYGKNKGKMRLDEFFKEEKREINELATGKESFKKYCQDSCSLVVEYFVPNECNDFKPKVLRPRSLTIILIAMIALKVFVSGYLFLVYPNEARMSSEMADEILQLTNKSRAEEGLAVLKTNIILNKAAEEKANDMAAKDYFAHYGPDGKKPWDWIDRGQYAYLLIGENLGMNFSTAEAVHTALMNSPSHRKNIMNAKYEDMGIAIISCVIDGEKTNVLVELFGQERTKTLAVESKAVTTVAGTTPKVTTPAKPAVTPTVTTPAVKPATIETKPVAEKPAEKPVEKVVEQPVENKEITGNNDVKSAELVPEETTVPEQVVEEISEESLIANLNDKVELVKSADKTSATANVVKISKIIYLVVLALMIAFLLINIFVRFTVQHRSIIIPTIVLILFITGLLTINIHTLESISGLIAIV